MTLPGRKVVVVGAYVNHLVISYPVRSNLRYLEQADAAEVRRLHAAGWQVYFLNDQAPGGIGRNGENLAAVGAKRLPTWF